VHNPYAALAASDRSFKPIQNYFSSGFIVTRKKLETE
jgi:hypothetical protein